MPPSSQPDAGGASQVRAGFAALAGLALYLAAVGAALLLVASGLFRTRDVN
jgi:hypothetical protein